MNTPLPASPSLSVEPLCAFDIFQGGRAQALSLEDIEQSPSPDVIYRWVHLDLVHDNVAAWIKSHVDDTVASTLTLEDTRPRSTKHDDGVLLNLRGVNLNPASDPEDMVSIRLWVEEKKIISVRVRRLTAIVSLREQMDKGIAPVTPGAFITTLAASLTERMDPVISALADKVDELEETSLEAPQGLRTNLAAMRRTVIMLRRYIAPQREALGRLSQDAKTLLDNDDHILLRETVDRITRMVEELDAVRERSAILYDQLSDQRAEEMNRNMLILSVVAAVFLPLGFLTGLLGVNIGGIPGADNKAAFAMFCLMLTVIAGALLWWFHKKKWI